MATTLFIKLLATTFVFFLVLVSGKPTLHKRYAVKDYHPSPRGWNNRGKAPSEHLINLSIGLKQANFKELERQLYEVSDPNHVRYGQHLSAEEVHSLVKPSTETYDSVHEWLAEHGIESQYLSYSPAKDFIKVALPVDKIEKLLDTVYSVWEHDDGSTLVRTESFSLPLYLHDHISTVQPTNSWARLNAHRQVKEIQQRDLHILRSRDVPLDGTNLPLASDVAAACNFSMVTPTCIRTLYGTINYTPQSGGKSVMGSTNYLGEYNNRSDTSLYLQQYRPKAAQAANQFRQISVNGGEIDNNTVHSSIQELIGYAGNLESQTLLGIGWPLNLTTYSTGGQNATLIPSLLSELVESTTGDSSNEPFLDWANYLAAQATSDIPQVISSSYYDEEQTTSKDYALAVCQQFAQLGARGITLLFSTGNFGVGLNDTCYSNKDNSTKMFLPQFPASCPYVTAVGATVNFPEEAAYFNTSRGNQLATGAGFSNYYPMPDYQRDVVGTYVQGLNGLHDGLYNKTGRAFPDISCVGQTLPVYYNGTQDSIYGPGPGTPVCTAVLALVNDALLANGKKPLGFLNPWLYGGGYKAFTDVTKGNAVGCQTTGFPAKAGWDAATGWGTPYFPRILKALGIDAASTTTTTTTGTIAPTATTTTTKGVPTSTGRPSVGIDWSNN